MNDPVNYQGRDLGYIDQDVTYAKNTFQKIMNAIELCGGVKENLKLIELGPGTDFGAQLLIASTGIDVTLADRYLARWNPDYHPLMYRRLCDEWDGPKGELEKALQNGGYGGTRLNLREEPAEHMASLVDGSFDIVYSNAVLEHITDLGEVAHEIARITKPDGHGYHQIDWRDHRNFDRPLDHITVKESTFYNLAEESFWEIGNRLRSIEFWAHFEAVGFQVFDRIVSERATRNYLAEITPKLRHSLSSYRFWPERDLDKVSGALVMCKLGGPLKELSQQRALDTLALVDAVKGASMAAGTTQERLNWHTRSLDALEIVIDPSQFHQDGFMWSAGVEGLPIGDTVDDSGAARTQIYEDGDALGPAHAIHNQIKNLGLGRFSHWKDGIMFSTSDNTSPKENGRIYTIRIPTAKIKQSQ